jgi:hypothetical protein
MPGFIGEMVGRSTILIVGVTLIVPTVHNNGSTIPSTIFYKLVLEHLFLWVDKNLIS